MKQTTATLATMSLLLFGIARPVSAQSSNEANAADHFQRGLAHAQASEIDAAATEFEAAYEASPNYSVLYNLGRTYLAMGRVVEAADTLTRYLTEGGTVIALKRRTEVERSIAQCEKRIGRLELDLQPANATVEVDGRGAGAGSPVLRLVAGHHALVVNAPGFRSSAQAFSIVTGKATLVHVRLEAEAQPTPGLFSVFVSCPVPDVNVFVDESSVGITPIPNPLNITIGQHRLSFRRAGYVATELNWVAGSSSTVDCAMRVANSLGSDAAALHVDANELDVQVIVDGILVSQSSVPFGRHRVEVRKFGFRNWTKHVYLRRGEVERLAVTLVPLPEYTSERQHMARNQRLIGYGVAGAGTAFLITAGALTLASSHAYADWRSSHDALAATPVTDPNYATMQDAATRKAVRVQALDTWRLSTAIVGSTALITGAVLVLTSPDPPGHELPAVTVAANALNVEWCHAF